jgi:hypothetical protein
MSATIDIIIRGIAICYKKPKSTKVDLWRVLFPFDDENLAAGKKLCHELNFSSKVGDAPELPGHERPLAKPRGVITIKASQNKLETSSESDNFKEYALDLTNTATGKPKTHGAVELKEKDTENWRKGTVLMKIDVPAVFSVCDYIHELTSEDIFLNEHNGTVTSGKQHDIIAHSVKATFELDEDETLQVFNGTDRLETITVEDKKLYTLIFNNDCKIKRPGKNDMEMFYEKTIVEPGKPNRKFLITDKLEDSSSKKGDAELESIPEISLAEGKPCLSVYVSKSEGLPEDAAA